MFTRVVGLIYIIFGVCAFIPALNGGPGAVAVADTHRILHFETLFWIFPCNFVLGGLMIGLGVAGVVSSGRVHSSRLFDRVLLVSALVLMVLGFCPHPLSELFGLMPLYGWTCGLFLSVALFSFYPALFDGPVPPSASEPVFHQ
jgi:hypothetical protein